MSDEAFHVQRPFKEWADFEIVVMLKVPLAKLQPILPARFTPVLAAPGMGLVCLGAQHITHTDFCVATNVSKTYLGVAVEPRYDLGTATPRISLALSALYADNPIFTGTIEASNLTPLHRGSNLVMHFDYETLAVSARDDDGPIFDLQFAIPTPSYTEGVLWSQARVTHEGQPYVQTMRSELEAFEHIGIPHIGKIHPHPYFGGMDVTGLDECGYHLFAVRPGHESCVTLFAPRLESQPRM